MTTPPAPRSPGGERGDVGAVEAACRCVAVGSPRDPYEPHIPAQIEWEQADDCPVHPLTGGSLETPEQAAQRIYNHHGYHANAAEIEDAMRAFVHGAKWQAALAADREPGCQSCHDGRDLTPGWECSGCGRHNEGEDARADREPGLREAEGIRFRVEVACDGYANLLPSDVPEDVVEMDDYLRGAHDAAEAIRTALALAAHPSPPRALGTERSS